jgi:diguanylate cyclase (GGDEF)-like protein
MHWRSGLVTAARALTRLAIATSELMAVWHFQRPRIPKRVAVISAAALLAPFVYALVGGGNDSGLNLLLWLGALIPAFLLAYYRGWRGAATALAAGMAVLTVTQVALLLLRRAEPVGWVPVAIVAVYMVVALAAGWVAEMLHSQRAAAEHLALTDDLTRVANRRRVRMFLEEEFAAARIQGPMAIVIFDLDSFKNYNDTYGHGAGDIALCNFARALSSATGPEELSARYGGEEFLAVLPLCDASAALSFVERVRRMLKQIHPNATALTASAGIACYQPGMASPNDLLIAADLALYDAKVLGPDTVRVFTRSMAVA